MKLGTSGRWGEFLWELHSLSTLGYIRRSQKTDNTGTDKVGAVKTKRPDRAKTLQGRGEKVEVNSNN